MQSLILTDRKQQYEAAPRAIKESTFPTPGFYFIRGLREKKDDTGNIYPSAYVNWKQNEDDSWEDYKENRFYLRLDYLFGDFSIKPKVSYQDLRHQVIHVKSAYINNINRGSKSISRVFADWDITGFTDMFDAMPYFNLFHPIVLAMEDAKLEADEVEQLAIMSDEFDEQEAEEEPQVDDYESDDDVVDQNED